MTQELPEDMEASEQDSEPSPSSSRLYGRRALMLGAGAAGAGVIATLAGSAGPAAAASDNPVELGESNSASASTVITTTTGNGLNGITTSDETYACGLLGESEYGIGVYGTQASTSGLLGSDSNPASAAVVGDSGAGAGVLGLSSSANGVFGITGNTGSSGVAGVDESTEAPGGHGVYGRSALGTGVYGTITGDTTGQSGVAGVDDSTGTGGGHGVYGRSTSGVGVYGQSKTGVGVTCVGEDGGTALKVEGVANFSRSGHASVLGSRSSPGQMVTVQGVALTEYSLILATAQEIIDGLSISGVKPDVSANSFEIWLTGVAEVDVKIAWFVIG
jgi:hypothetical protein